MCNIFVNYLFIFHIFIIIFISFNYLLLIIIQIKKKQKKNEKMWLVEKWIIEKERTDNVLKFLIGQLLSGGGKLKKKMKWGAKFEIWKVEGKKLKEKEKKRNQNGEEEGV